MNGRWPMFAITCLGLWATLGGCSDSGYSEPTTGSHIGNPADLSFRLTIGGQVAAMTPFLVDGADTDHELTSVRAVLSEIHLHMPVGVSCDDIARDLQGADCVPEDDQNEGDAVVVRGPFLMNLLTGTSLPSLSDVRLPALDYTEVELRFARADELLGISPDDVLLGHSVVFETRFDRPEPTRLIAVLDLTDLEEVSLPSVEANAGGSIVIGLEADRWLREVDVGGCVSSGTLAVNDDAVIVTDQISACDSIGEKIEHAFEESLSSESEEREDEP